MPYTAIQTESMPHIILGDHRSALPWHYGPMFTSRLATGYTRLSNMGLVFGNLDGSTRLERKLRTWNSEHCVASREALCEHREGGVSAMLFFPQGVVDIPEDFSQVYQNSFTSAYPNGSSCTSPDSGRVIQPEDRRYEVSLCDLVDQSMDFVYEHARARVYWRKDTTSTATFLFVCVLSVYIVSCLAQNVKNTLNNKRIESEMTQHMLLVLMFLFITFELFASDLSTSILTDSDWYLFCVLYIYAFLEAALQWCCVFTPRHRSFISPLTVCLLLLVSRIHYTFDTPYTELLTVVFGTRNWYKFLSVRLETVSRAEVGVFVLDLCVYMALLCWGVRHNASSELQCAISETLIFTLSTLMGTILFIYSFIFEPVV